VREHSTRPKIKSRLELPVTKNHLPSPELLRKLLRYDPRTGKLFWRDRSPDMFPEDHKMTPEKCDIWNAEYAGRETFTSVVDGLLVGSIWGQNYPAHRVAYAIQTGCWPEGMVDHVDGDGGNNRWGNLRLFSDGHTHGIGRRDVCWNRKKNIYSASIVIDGRRNYLGLFGSREKAEKAYTLAAKKHLRYLVKKEAPKGGFEND